MLPNVWCQNRDLLQQQEPLIGSSFLLVQYVPNTSQSSLIVGVRVRPLLKQEKAKEGRRDIIRVIDDRIVLVLDPDESKVSAASLPRSDSRHLITDRLV